MNPVIELKTRFGTYWKASIGITSEMLEKKEACDFQWQDKLAEQALIDAGQKIHDKPYLYYRGWHGGRNPTICEAVTMEWDKKALAAYDKR